MTDNLTPQPGKQSAQEERPFGIYIPVDSQHNDLVFPLTIKGCLQTSYFGLLQDLLFTHRSTIWNNTKNAENKLSKVLTFFAKKPDRARVLLESLAISSFPLFMLMVFLNSTCTAYYAWLSRGQKTNYEPKYSAITEGMKVALMTVCYIALPWMLSFAMGYSAINTIASIGVYLLARRIINQLNEYFVRQAQLNQESTALDNPEQIIQTIGGALQTYCLDIAKIFEEHAQAQQHTASSPKPDNHFARSTTLPLSTESDDSESDHGDQLEQSVRDSALTSSSFAKVSNNSSS